MGFLAGYLDVSNLHIMAVVVSGLGLFAAGANLWFAARGRPRTLRRYMFVKFLITLAIAVLYFLDVVGVVDPSCPATIGRSVVMVLMVLLCTDVFVRRGEAEDIETVSRFFKDVGGHADDA